MLATGGLQLHELAWARMHKVRHPAGPATTSWVFHASDDAPLDGGCVHGKRARLPRRMRSLSFAGEVWVQRQEEWWREDPLLFTWKHARGR